MRNHTTGADPVNGEGGTHKMTGMWGMIFLGSEERDVVWKGVVPPLRIGNFCNF